jgi:hypothetical protein
MHTGVEWITGRKVGVRGTGRGFRQCDCQGTEIAPLLYEDVIPALTELRAMGLQLIVASSLSCAALNRFLESRIPAISSAPYGAAKMPAA